MDLVVHGTKDGRNTFTLKKVYGLIDITADNCKVTSIGQFAYGLRFTLENTIFSKYKIIRDVAGSKRTGFVGFSLFLKQNEKMAGTDIRKLLDRLTNEYCAKYIVDNNLENVSEDWAFLDTIHDDFINKVNFNSSEIDNLESGNIDDAIIYYYNEAEADMYFDSPFQEEYKSYRQIVFIDINFKSRTENPIYAIRNSGIELNNIDLENKYYFLKNTFSGITVTANGKNRSELKNNNRIRAKEKIEIVFSKDAQYFEEIRITGTLFDKNSTLFNYLELQGTNIFIKKEAFNYPIPKSKEVTIEIIDYKNNPVYESTISLNDNSGEKVHGNLFKRTFKGEELGKVQTITCKKEDFFEKLIFTPNSAERVALKLKKQKIVPVFATDSENGDNINNVHIKINNKYITVNKNEIIFENEEIDKTWEIEISGNIGQTYYSSKVVSFNPQNGDNPLYVKLNRKSTNGLNESLSAATSNSIVKKPWYKNPQLLIPGIITFGTCLILGLVIWISQNNKKDNNNSTTQKSSLYINKSKIDGYLSGNELNLGTLNNYKENWEKQKPVIIKNSSWLYRIGLGSNEPDSTDYKAWADISNRLDIAIKTEEDKTQNGDNHEIKSTRTTDPKTAADTTRNLPKKEMEKNSPKSDNTSSNGTTLSTPLKDEKIAVNMYSKINEIKAYIKGYELKEEKLIEFRDIEGLPSDIKKSIIFCLDYLALDNRGNKKYDSFLDKIKNDKYLKGSELIKALEDVKGESNPNYSTFRKEKLKLNEDI